MYFKDDYLYLGSTQGSYQIRSRVDLNRELEIKAHDVDTGII